MSFQSTMWNKTCHIPPHPPGLFCQVTWCELSVCEHGDCQTIGADPGFKCQCTLGFWGTRCHMDDGTCRRDECNNRGTCIGNASQPVCECDAHETGRNSETPDGAGIMFCFKHKRALLVKRHVFNYLSHWSFIRHLLIGWYVVRNVCLSFNYIYSFVCFLCIHLYICQKYSPHHHHLWGVNCASHWLVGCDLSSRWLFDDLLEDAGCVFTQWQPLLSVTCWGVWRLITAAKPPQLMSFRYLVRTDHLVGRSSKLTPAFFIAKEFYETWARRAKTLGESRNLHGKSSQQSRIFGTAGCRLENFNDHVIKTCCER